MTIKRLFRWARSSTAPRPPVAPTSDGGSDETEDEIPRYPPDQRGLPVCSVERLLEAQRPMITEIRHALPLTPEDFSRLIEPILRRYAEFVHLLPASAKHHHRGAGGLLRHGLEVAFWAARASGGVVFVAGGTPLERKELEPRWRVAVCLAGLLHDVGKPLSDVSVVGSSDADAHTEEWDPYRETIPQWAAARGITRYYLHWHQNRHRRHQSFAFNIVGDILTPEIKIWLSRPQREIMGALHDAILLSESDHPVSRLVHDADQYSTSKDMRDIRHEPDEGLGVPLERYLLDAMRRLVGDGTWRVNERGARVWVTTEGVFVVWKPAAAEIFALLMEDEIKGIPKDPASQADILLDRDYAIPYVADDGARYPYWPVAPDLLHTSTGTPVVLDMLRLSGTHLLFSTQPPTVVTATIGGNATGLAPSPRAISPTPPVAPSKIISVPDHAPPAAQEPEKTITINPAPRHGVASKAQEAQRYFAGQGKAGEIMTAMVRDIAQGDSRWGEALCRVEGRIVVRYPDGTASYGGSTELLSLFDQAGWVESDPGAPGRKVRAIDGVRGLVLAPPVASLVSAIAELASPTPPADGEPKPPSRGTAERADPAMKRKPTPSAAAPPPKPLTAAASDSSIPSRTVSDGSAPVEEAVEELVELVRRRSDIVPTRIMLMTDGTSLVSVEIVNWYAEHTTFGITEDEFKTALARHPCVTIAGDKLYIRAEKPPAPLIDG